MHEKLQFLLLPSNLDISEKSWSRSTSSRLLFGINMTLNQSNGSILPPLLVYNFDTLLESVLSFPFHLLTSVSGHGE